MGKKAIGVTCALICMASVAIYFIWGMIAKSYENAWIIFIIAGIACAAVSMIGGYKSEKKEEKPQKKSEDK